MATILKNDGVFSYNDFTLDKIAGRMRELAVDGVFPIRREPGGDIQAYLVSEIWYQAKVAAYDAVPLPLPTAKYEEVADDSLAVNLSLYVDIVNGRAQVKSQLKRVVTEGPGVGEFMGYIAYNTRAAFYDNRDEGIKDVGDMTDLRRSGTYVARLLDPVHYQTLFTGP